ncbi:MAG: site-specific DNA-methyltransferase [Bacteroidales bacterium]|jgi:adenine-specific DNA-methyltransferase
MIRQIIQSNEAIKSNHREMEILRKYFPQCFTNEGAFDIDLFKAQIEEDVNITHEGYDLNFLGKNYAKLLSSIDTTTVVIPDEKHNALPENANSQNIYISGDNLDGLKHLLKSYAGAIKCIYIDPPYNTGTDGFVYNDRFAFTAEELSIKLSISETQAEKILDLTRRGSASHSAWLTFMASRLQLARDLLTDDGVIFISIDDNEQANLKILCDSIFGEENFVATFPWRKRTAKSDVPFGVSQDFEWVLCYGKEDYLASIEGGTRKYYETDDLPNRPWRIHDLTTQRSAAERPNSFFTMINPKTGEEYPANPTRTWAMTKDTFEKYYEENRIVFPGDYDFLNISKPAFRYFQEDDINKAGEMFGFVPVSTNLPGEIGMSQDGTKDFDALFENKLFAYPKPISLMYFLIKISTNFKKDAIILDFFSGSATTAQAVMQLNAEDGGNRRYIMVQLPEETPNNSEARKAGYETIDQIGIERIRRAAAKIKSETDADIDYGFKHYTLAEPDNNTLDKIEEFNPRGVLADETLLDTFGKPTVLETWLVRDGYGFGANVQELKLKNYTVYHFGKHLYFIDTDFDENDMVALIDHYSEQASFCPDHWVLFGYSFTLTQTEMLRKNAIILRDGDKNLNINIDVRY